MADIVASSPLSRTSNLRRTTFTGSIFGGRGSAANPMVQPTEKLLDPNEVSLRRVSNQLASLTTQMNDVGGALERIAYYIAQDTSLENLKTRQEQAQEKQLVEEGRRTREESVIETKIKSALMAPVQAVAQRTQSILSGLMRFFTTLFLGWLTMRGMDTLKALSEGNTRKLEEIRDSVLKNLGIAGATLYLLNGGFFAIIGTIGSITFNLTKALGKFLILKPLQFIANLIKDAVKNIIKPAGKVGAEAAAEAVTKAGTKAGAEAAAEAVTKAGAKTGAEVAGAAAKGGLGLAGRALPFIGTGIDLGLGAGELMRGNITGAGLYGAAAGLSLIPGAQGFSLATSLAATGQSMLYTPEEKKKEQKTKSQSQSQSKPQTVINNKGQSVTVGKPYAATQGGVAGAVTYDKTGKATFKESTPEAKPQPPEAKPQPPAAQPQTPMTPNASQYQLNVNNYSGVFSGEEQNSSQTSMTGDTQVSPDNMDQIEPIAPPQAQIAPIPVSEMQQRTEQLSAPLPEPKPNVVMAKTSSGQQQVNQESSITGPANSVPSISSSNPENFYTLYSQVHYNVVV